MDVNNPDDMAAMKIAIEKLKQGVDHSYFGPPSTSQPTQAQGQNIANPTPTQTPVQDQQTMQQNAQPLIDALKRKHADDQLKGLFPSE